ncbi:MAG: FmdB family zinc ribbon protein [Bryobacteraceae bacterium]
MPIYEYQCDTCGTVYEVMQKFADQPLSVHEGCGGAVHRLISAPALQFKGTGWYVTDYGKGGNGKPGSGSAHSKAGSSDSTKSESKSDSKSESKKESKSETKSDSKPSSGGSPAPAPATAKKE